MVMVTVRKKQTTPLSGSKRNLIACLALWLTIVSTAGCDSSSSGMPASRGEVRTEKLKTNLTAEEARELAQPITATPGLTVETGAAQNAAIGNEVFDNEMNPAKGLSTKRLFGTAAANDDERFERLEAAMQKMRDDFDSVSPSINRLMAIEQEIQTLVDQLQVLTGEAPASPESILPIPPVSSELLEEPTTMPPLPADAAAMAAATPPLPPAPPVETTPPAVPEPAPAKAAVPPPAPVANGAILTALRVGDHEKTTRIVFETTKEIAYTADIDPEKILLVNFASGTSQLGDAALKPKSDLVKSVDITPQGSGGFIAAMTLSKMTKIVRQGILPPDGGNPNYRIYIDIER